jgi:hypothetical protein
MHKDVVYIVVDIVVYIVVSYCDNTAGVRAANEKYRVSEKDCTFFLERKIHKGFNLFRTPYIFPRVLNL